MPGQVTRLLDAMTDGEESAAEELLPLVYDELRRIARGRMARERQGLTLQPTALVHEAYLRLIGDEALGWENRRHFYAAAAEAMRRILIERARRISREKHGGKLQRAPLADDISGDVPRAEELLALDHCLRQLEERDHAMAQVVQLRFFAGLSIHETSQVLDVSPRTVNRLWTGARAWLGKQMGNPAGEPWNEAPGRT